MKFIKSKKIFNTGYVIMPNHLHLKVYTQNELNTINDIIAEMKRFMAYEIVKRLKVAGRNDLLKFLYDTVNPGERLKGKIHNVFQPSAETKKIFVITDQIPTYCNSLEVKINKKSL